MLEYSRRLLIQVNSFVRHRKNQVSSLQPMPINTFKLERTLSIDSSSLGFNKQEREKEGEQIKEERNNENSSCQVVE